MIDLNMLDAMDDVSAIPDLGPVPGNKVYDIQLRELQLKRGSSEGKWAQEVYIQALIDFPNEPTGATMFKLVARIPHREDASADAAQARSQLKEFLLGFDLAAAWPTIRQELFETFDDSDPDNVKAGKSATIADNKPTTKALIKKSKNKKTEREENDIVSFVQ